MRSAIRQWAIEAGASRCGFAAARTVDPAAAEIYERWTARGAHGSMQYCAKYADVRRDPRLLLEGARTVISCAFCYNAPQQSAIIAKYALGLDYHWVVKERLMALGRRIEEAFGGQTRPLVDTAPMRERYWAQQAGLGFIGINNQLIIPGLGSYFFLGELLWTGELEPDAPCTEACKGCMACVKACPGGALDGQGGCDARRCLSYLTIEHRGPLPAEPSLGGKAYGCDACQKVCPHNQGALFTGIPELQPRPEILALTPQDLLEMTPSHYKKLVARSAMRRAPLSQLLRNLQSPSATIDT